MNRLKQSITALPRRFSSASVPAALAVLVLISFFLALLCESFGRRSLFEAFGYMLSAPGMFFCNQLIILFTLSLCLLSRRRLIVLLVLCTTWFGLGLANFIVLSFRSSPLSAIDFLIIRSAVGMVTLYLTVVQIILIAILTAAFLLTLVLLWKKCPRCPVSYRHAAACIVIIGISVWGATTLAADRASAYESEDLPEVYEGCGFAYCFTQSLIAQGVERPEDYDADEVDELIEALGQELATDSLADADHTPPPNIVFVQLESFFDISKLTHLTCSDDPTPNFTTLKESGVSGYLTVPHVGGGTANIEFEVLTGMNLDHFGLGEYPYTTVLRSRACESIAANLAKLGMPAHALHNHTASFYSRDIAYASLGFDTFTPVELMTDISRNPLGWARDTVLTDEILAALDSTGMTDFVFAVSVQAHGNYPDEVLDEESVQKNGYTPADFEEFITVSGAVDETEHISFTYYVNQLYEVDAFIGELTEALEARGEPTVAVFYGDHLPALALTDDKLESGSLYKTEYAVWSNFTLPVMADTDDPNAFDRDLEAYLLSAYILSLCKIDEGDITRLHQHELETGELLDEELRMLEYAQLYDEETEEFQMTELRFGIRPITVENAFMSGNTLFVTGDGFNEFSEVRLNGILRNTELADDRTLMVKNVFFGVDSLEVVQLCGDGTELACVPYLQ